VSRLRDERGFTLVELLLVTMLSLLLLGSTLAVFTTMERSTKRNQDQQDAQDQVRNTVDQLAVRLRNLASPVSTGGSAVLSIDKASAQDVIFRTVRSSGTGTTGNPTNVERDRFCLQSGTLYRQVQNWTTTDPGAPSSACGASGGWSSTRIVGQHITNGSAAVFTYFTTSASGVVSEQSSVTGASLGNVTSIRADLLVDADPHYKPTASELSTRVFLRNQNQPPTVDFTPTCGGTSRTVVLNGSASADPEGGPLTFAWYDGATQIGTGVTYTTGTLSVGTHSFSVKVADSSGLTTTSSTKTATINSTSCSVP
jgi:type II secretory pathway component PulJ